MRKSPRKRPVPIALVLLVVYLPASCGAQQEDRVGDSRTAFAASAGVEASQVESFRALDVRASEIETVAIGVVSREAGPVALLVPLRAGRAGAPLELGTARLVEPLAVVDLEGEPRSFDLTDLPPLDERPLRAPERAKRPALLMLASQRSASGEERDALVLCSLTARPSVLWRETSRSLRANGAGHQSFEVGLAQPESGSGPLEVELYQTTVPARDGPPSHPGPPLLLRFRLSGNAYERAD